VIFSPEPSHLKPPAKTQNSSWPRVITAAILLPVLIASILLSWLPLIFIVLAAAAMVLGLYEFYFLARQRGIKPNIAAGYLAAGALFTVFAFTEPGKTTDLDMVQLILIILTIGVLVAGSIKGPPFDQIIANTGSTILGVLYVVLLGGHLVAVRTGFQPKLSTHLLGFFFLVIMGADVAAYYVGRAVGKHKLAPNISPGKTWEGVIGGVVGAVAMALLSHYWFFRDFPLKWSLPLAVVMTVLGVFGDLTESVLKRSAGAKDAAKILPGHGGLLDRLDSLLFNAPLIYYFGKLYFEHLFLGS